MKNNTTGFFKTMRISAYRKEETIIVSLLALSFLSGFNSVHAEDLSKRDVSALVEGVQSQPDGYMDDYLVEESFVAESGIPEVLTEYEVAAAWVIENLIPVEMWEDTNYTDFENLWWVIDELTKSKLEETLIE